MRLSVNVQAGTAPLDVSLHVDSSFAFQSVNIQRIGPAPVKLTQESVSQCTLNFPAEGTYTITATVNGPDGKTYQDSVKILVLSKIGMDRIVKQKWNGIKAKLTALDVEGAVSFLPTVYQDKYRQIFTAFGQHLPVLGEDSPPEFVYVANDIMKALVFREETVPGGTAVIGYPMYLIQEGGIWKFDNF